MKLTLKKMAFALSLGLGLGVSATVSASSAIDCDVLSLKCAQGNDRACQIWELNCYTGD